MQEISSRRSNKSRTKETRTALIAAARELFAKDGYAQTSTPQIAAKANVTRGALYHHFSDKEDLFLAVFEHEAEAVTTHIQKNSSAKPSARDALIAGSEAYFHAMAVPGRSRLLLLDGPFVLDPAKISEVYARTSRKQLLEGLIIAMKNDPTKIEDLTPLAELLSAAYDRAALAIAEGAPKEEYTRMIELIIDRLLMSNN